MTRGWINLVSLERVEKRYAERQILDGVTLGIQSGDRIGVIGANGSGKSTLLRIIAAVEEPDAGQVVVGSRVRLHYLPQEPWLDPRHSVLEAVLADDTAVARTVREYERLMAILRDRPDDASATRHLHSLQAAMDAVDGWTLERRAVALLHRLGLQDTGARVGTRSGGQRKRIGLARALVGEPEPTAGGQGLLILDEPTNHLDVEAVEWLEDELDGSGQSLVVVTHDRYLLDRLVNRIVEIEGGRLHSHGGSYAAYLEGVQARRAREEQEDRKRASLARTELQWLRRTPAARTSKSKARSDRARHLLEQGPTSADPDLALGIPSRRLGSKVVNLDGVGKRYGERWVLRDLDLKLAPGDRVAIVGPNASGKTTLLQIMAGLIQPDEGRVDRGETVALSLYGQDPEPLPEDMSAFEAVDEIVRESQVGGRRLGASQLLDRFGFPPRVQRSWVGQLSGGERRRLELLRVLGTAPNVLLLDEPTNDLDLETLRLLEDELDQWPGTLVAATHDRYFIDRTCEQVYSIEMSDGVGRLIHHPEGWEGWRRRRRQEKQARPDAGRTRPEPSGLPRAANARKLSFNEQRELAQLEQRIPELVALRDTLARSLSDLGSDYEKYSRVAEQLAVTVAELNAAEERWLELEAIREDSS